MERPNKHLDFIRTMGKAEETLKGLKTASENAHYWNSFDPARAGRVELEGYMRSLCDDLQIIKAAALMDKDRYCEQFRAKVCDLFARESRIASAAVTGPARFPVAKNQKAISSYAGARADFEEWRKKATKAILRRIENSKTQEQRDYEEWMETRKKILIELAAICDIDENKGWGYRALFVSNLYNFIERKARNGKMAIVEKAMALVEEYNGKHKKPIFTRRHKWYRLPELVKQCTTEQEETANSEPKVYAFEGFKIVKDFADNRLRILFDEKPAADVREKMKHNGFRWSPSAGAWQRQLTHNAVYSLRYLGLGIERLAD